MRTNLLAFLTAAAIVLVSNDAHAYVGPGLGAGAIGMILGVIASILLAIFAIFWYPIKRIFKSKKKDNAEGASVEEASVEEVPVEASLEASTEETTATPSKNPG